MPELTINYLPPSPNRMRGKHWGAVASIRKDAAWATWYAWNKAHRPSAEGRSAVLDATVHAHGVAGDPDNAWARLKPCLDELVRQGALVDDSPKWLTLGSITHQKAPPRRGHITIRITYQEGAPDA